MTTRRLPQIPSIPHDLPDDLRRVLLALKERNEIEHGERPNQNAGDALLTRTEVLAEIVTGAALPLTTEGDIIVGDTSGAASRLARGTEGQMLGSLDSALKYADRVASSAAQSFNGVRSLDFTSIPSWAKVILINVMGVSTDGTTDRYLLRLGTGGAADATNDYKGNARNTTGGTLKQHTTTFNLTTGVNAVGDTLHGGVLLTIADASTNTWIMSSELANDDGALAWSASGEKSLSGALDMVQFRLSGSTDTGDAGKVSISYW